MGMFDSIMMGRLSNADNTKYIGVYCLSEPGRYKFTINDLFKDGMCCETDWKRLIFMQLRVSVLTMDILGLPKETINSWIY